MNKKELVVSVAEQVSLPRNKAELVVNAFIHQTQEALARGGTVQLVGFGSFTVVDRAARKGRNPQTGQEIHIPACKLPQFKPGNKFRDMVK